MFVFIAHAEADQAAADDLKAFLNGQALVAETETGARGFRRLQESDIVVALWSQKSVFGLHRMMMEKRMLDVWADGRLVLGKLDHSILPVGMRDLAVIDASFESGRKLSVWPQVGRAAKEAVNAALVPRSEAFWKSSPPPPKERARGGGMFGFRKVKKAAPAAAETASEQARAPPVPGAASAPAAAMLLISCAHVDNASVQPVVEVLKGAGREVWIDKGGIEPGENWAGEIVRGIKGSTGVMVMCSPRAFESDHIKREV